MVAAMEVAVVARWRALVVVGVVALAGVFGVGRWFAPGRAGEVSGASVPTAAVESRGVAGVTVRIAVVEPDLGMVIVVRTAGADATAWVETAAGLVGEERQVGDDYFVHVPGAAAVFGLDRWVHVDRRVEPDRTWFSRHQLGLVELADAGARTAGDELLGGEILTADATAADVVRFTVAGVGVVVVTTTVDGDAQSVPVPTDAVPLASIAPG